MGGGGVGGGIFGQHEFFFFNVSLRNDFFFFFVKMLCTNIFFPWSNTKLKKDIKSFSFLLSQGHNLNIGYLGICESKLIPILRYSLQWPFKHKVCCIVRTLVMRKFIFFVSGMIIDKTKIQQDVFSKNWCFAHSMLSCLPSWNLCEMYGRPMQEYFFWSTLRAWIFFHLIFTCFFLYFARPP